MWGFKQGSVGLALLLAPAWAGAQQPLEQVVQKERDITVAAQQSQKRIDQLDDESQRLYDEFRRVQDQIETLRAYNQQLRELISAQERDLAQKNRDIEEVERLARSMLPHMNAMIDTLGQWVELDVPFLLNERRGRVERLRELMDRADVTESEKYRLIIEAYQIENDYGRAIDTYRGPLVSSDSDATVDYLKIGRVAFLYLTLDDREAGVWDQNTRSWVDASGYVPQIRQALRMANKQAGVDLVTLPVPAPTDVERNPGVPDAPPAGVTPQAETEAGE